MSTILTEVFFDPCRVVVGAPQEIKAVNQTGGLYQCDYSTAMCEPIHLQGKSLSRPGTQGQLSMLWGPGGVQETHFLALALSADCHPQTGF